ncbi:FecCD family ABC transporter permease [Lentilactobacillus kisonensis]|uniref:Probable heme-iron transport system permease protein IsdF n=2 Tax=Lentilactobacillus kisonensis TaxID=481722 RepID=H1LIS7_9LACO|nr:iron ABC transporter permease [Lentilactobacillus kisonensis]EHO49556.1 iron chelate uptake ABC transporter, FeCT family, permease protein [Lentilactobacillus kisonensis F0435]KRL20798.1 iron chelate uptake ABC transporter, FeCT family, permease protein [Lentilactobacillus kisonensis DSM 19906 = JCM 15041]
MNNSEKLWYLVIICLLIVTILISFTLGASFISPQEMISAFSGHHPNQNEILLTIRAPRILAALLCGAMLAVAGALSQSAFKNILADPSILGITSAAELFVTFGGFLLPTFTGGKLIDALLGGAFALLFLTSRSVLKSPYKLIIVGVALMLTFSGFQQLFSDGMAQTTTGSLNGITWSDTTGLLILGVSGMLIAVLVSPWANYLKLSGVQLQTKGASPLLMRFSLLAVMVYLSAGTTAVVGIVPFVGIVVPNVARHLVGRDYTTLIPMSMLLGAWLLLVVDTIGRIVVLPSELSAATLMTVLGGPFLVVMLQRRLSNGIKSS